MQWQPVLGSISECGDVAVLDDDVTAGVGEDVVDKCLLTCIQLAVCHEQDGTLNGINGQNITKAPGGKCS